MKTTEISPSHVLEHVRELLNQNRAEEALGLLRHWGQKTPEVENARAVCLLRLGKLTEATSILRSLVFRSFVCMPDDVPVLFQANFATAMLMANFKDAALPIVDRLGRTENPQIVRVIEAVQQWKKSIGLWGRLRTRFGFYPKKPVPLDFPPGQA